MVVHETGSTNFVSVFMLASKVICDDTYSSKSWSIVAQGMFQLREINQMDKEMCQYLEWELNVDPVTLHGLGVSSPRVCSNLGRSIRWTRRCVST
jgi:hypothetical protein